MNTLCTMTSMDFVLALLSVIAIGTVVAFGVTALYVIYVNAVRRREGRARRDAWRQREREQ